jgi:hypothetical protein
MSYLDDDIDDLLQGFRADEARIDHSTRARIWAQICDEAPDAPTALDTLARGARVRRLRRRAPSLPRIGAVAAAVLVLLAVAGLVVRSGPNDDAAVTAGPSTTIPAPRDLEEFADRVVVLPTTVLGETDDTRYTYRSGVRRIQGAAFEAVQHEQRWIARDGRGRELIAADGKGADSDNTMGQGSYEIGYLPPRTALGLPDEADTELATFARGTGVEPGDFLNPMALIDLLTYTGLPAPARAGALRALDRLGFAPVPDADLGPNLWRVEGSGPEGSTLQADFDLRTGEVTALALLSPDGGFDRLTDIEADLRPDTRGS